MNIYQKLNKIQTELKAPKNQYNSFGKYKYRSLEDIQEGLKPLLEKYKAAIILNDEIKMIGSNYYVEATATLIDIENEENNTISVKASARESENKKGMDTAQVTGSTSSYARKYAMNGLFAIDDTKDADTDENNIENNNRNQKYNNNSNKQQYTPKKNVNGLATPKQIGLMINLAKEKNWTNNMSEYLQTTYRVQNSKQLTSKQASEVITMLQKIGI